MPLVVEELNPASLKAKEVATEEYVDTGLSEIDVSYEALSGKDQLAQQLGYNDYNTLVSVSTSGSTIINGSYLNTGLIEAGSIVADSLAADFIYTHDINAGNGKFTVNGSTGAVKIASADSGERMVIENDVLRVYDSLGRLRVKLGNLNA